MSTRYPIKSFHGALWYLPVWVESLARRVTPRPPASAAVLFRDRQKTGGFETPQKCTAKRSEIDSQTLTDRPTRPSLFSNAGGVQKAAPGEGPNPILGGAMLILFSPLLAVAAISAQTLARVVPQAADGKDLLRCGGSG